MGRKKQTTSPEEQAVTTTQKKRHKKYVMNSIDDINERCAAATSLSLVGASAMTFPDKISTVRSNMAVKHTSQYVVLSNPEFPRVYTGAENVFGERSSWNMKNEHSCKLVKKFVKFKNAPISPVVYVFLDLETNKYLCKQVNVAENLIERYGFRMYDRIKGKYNEGDILPSNTPVAQSSSYVNGNYCSGRNIRMLYTVLPELTEDAVIISESAAKELEYDMVDIVTVNLKRDAYLLNKYGDANLYKPFPNIGEYVHNDVICSIRENSFMSSYAEARRSHVNDRNYYSRGQIVDIDIFTNVDLENEELNGYLTEIQEWYQEIYTYLSTIVEDPYQDDVSLIDIYHRAEKYLSKSSWVTKEYIVDTIIQFKVLKHVPIHVGQKIVGRCGNKSVVTGIIPDRIMPHTDDGRPVQMVCNGLAVPNRIIGFPTYETTMTFMEERMHQHFLKMEQEGHSQDDIVALAVEFLSTFEPQEGSELAKLYRVRPNEVYNDIMKHGLFIQIMPLNDKCVRDALVECYNKWGKTIFKKYKVRTKLRHRWIEIEGEYAIGYQYTWVLKQEPSKAMSVVSTCKTTWYDQPVKSHLYGKNLRHYSDNPIKYGEYDSYNFLAAVGPKEFYLLTTLFRGSQYTMNSILMSHLNNTPIDTTKANQFPQLDNFRNVLKFIGYRLTPEIFNYNSAGGFDKLYTVMMGNNKIRISIPDLRHVLILNSYYMQYQNYKNETVEFDDFFKQIDGTNLFDNYPDGYSTHCKKLFLELLPIIQQMKQYR